jgi:DNA-binding CsgD family transcriptional regulator
VRHRLRSLYRCIGASNLGQAVWLLQDRLTGDPGGTVMTQAGGARTGPVAAPTPMQREVLMLVAVSGLSRAVAAQRLGISGQTLRNHLHELYERIGAGNMGEAVWLLCHELPRPG